jgi:hypothetical protein
MSAVRSTKIAAALKMVQAIAEAIRELREVPAGHLYAQVLGAMGQDEFDWIVGRLIGAGLVERTPSHLLRWKGGA